MADQSATSGIFISAASLRDEIVQDLNSNSFTGSEHLCHIMLMRMTGMHTWILCHDVGFMEIT